MDTPSKTEPSDHLRSEIIAQSPSMCLALRTLEKAAQTDWTVLLEGETGTGKTLLAHEIHRMSPRHSTDLVILDCAALPESLLESELFGHERGSFTGANQMRKGVFEQADGGTLVLDEIGNLAFESQATLLTVLQEGHVRRIGGREIPVDVRVIAVTNRDLPQMVREGSFRADLYHRLDVCRVVIPPVRDRRSDVPRLIQYYLRQAFTQLGRPCPPIPSELLSAAQAYQWPGNVREIQNLCRRIALLSEDRMATEEAVEALSGPSPTTARGESGIGSLGVPESLVSQATYGDMALTVSGDFWQEMPLSDVLRRVTRDVELKVISAALVHANGNKAKAARLLRINYKTLYWKLRYLGLSTYPAQQGP